MLPEEVQATMAKVLFIVFATIMLCLGRVKASSFNSAAAGSNITKVLNSQNHLSNQ